MTRPYPTFPVGSVGHNLMQLRGTWHEVGTTPAMPMFHPAALLRDASKKRLSWADLLSVKARLSDVAD